MISFAAYVSFLMMFSFIARFLAALSGLVKRSPPNLCSSFSRTDVEWLARRELASKNVSRQAYTWSSCPSSEGARCSLRLGRVVRHIAAGRIARHLDPAVVSTVVVAVVADTAAVAFHCCVQGGRSPAAALDSLHVPRQPASARLHGRCLSFAAALELGRRRSRLRLTSSCTLLEMR